MSEQERREELFLRLKKRYPEARIILNFSNEWELLVAVMLSAQCTDIMVNKVTETLFKKYKTIADYAAADISELEQAIRSTGFYRNKAKNLKSAASKILSDYSGKVPRTMELLLTLPGVARKTANVVLSNAFHINSGVAVDTHVMRLSQRLGLTTHTSPEKIEQDLMRDFPTEEWNNITYLLIEHGRVICKAQRPKCDACILSDICPSAFQFPNFQK